jgi:hypothetical protein
MNALGTSLSALTTPSATTHEVRTMISPHAAPTMPPELFEALVASWAEILVADYRARHPENVTPSVV